MAKLTYRGSLRKRGARAWEWRVSVHGERHSRTFHVKTKTEAASKANTEYDRLLRLHAGGGLTISGLVDEFLEAVHDEDLAPSTLKAYRQTFDALKAYLKAKRLKLQVADVGGADILKYLRWRRRHRRDDRSGKVSKRTVQRERTTLHTLFQHAVDMEIIETNPVARAKLRASEKPRKREPVILSPAGYETLLSECAHRPMLELYVLTLGETAGRCDSEVLWLRWEDVDLEGGFLQLRHDERQDGRRTKAKKSRWVPMSRRLTAAMRAHFAAYRLKTYRGQRTHWLFHHTTDRRRARAGKRIKSLRRGFRNAAKRAKLPDELHQHDLRHRRITMWVAQGKPTGIIQSAVGHADPRTTDGYTHLAREHLKMLVEDDGGPNVGNDVGSEDDQTA